MSDAELTIVMPVIERDAGYFLNFARTYRKNWKIRTDIVFMIRRSERETFINYNVDALAYISNNPLTSMRLVIKEDLIGDRHATMSGPFRAMACKLAIAEQVKTSFYLAMDADVLVMRPVTSMVELRTRRNRSARKRDHFYENAAKLVSCDPIPSHKRDVSLCPPMFYDPKVAAYAWEWSGGATGMLDTHEPWSEQAPWAEVFLYETLQRQTNDARYIRHDADLAPLTHDPVNPFFGPEEPQSRIVSPQREMFERCNGLFAAWHPTPNQDPPFTVIHSFTNISPTAIWDRIRDVI